MMQSLGVPSVLLHAKAYEYAEILNAKGEKVVDMSLRGTGIPHASDINDDKAKEILNSESFAGARAAA